MYYFNFRWYDPVIGHFTQQEPLGIDGPNQYHFCFNNPVNGYDPNGLWNLWNPFTWGDPNSVDDNILNSINPWSSGGWWEGMYETFRPNGTAGRVIGGYASGNIINNSLSAQIAEVERSSDCEEVWARRVMNGALITSGFAAVTALSAGAVEYTFLSNQSIRVFAHLRNLHLGLEYGNHLNIIHIGWHPTFGLHIAIGANGPWFAYHHIYILSGGLIRYWRPKK